MEAVCHSTGSAQVGECFRRSPEARGGWENADPVGCQHWHCPHLQAGKCGSLGAHGVSVGQEDWGQKDEGGQPGRMRLTRFAPSSFSCPQSSCPTPAWRLFVIQPDQHRWGNVSRRSPEARGGWENADPVGCQNWHCPNLQAGKCGSLGAHGVSVGQEDGGQKDEGGHARTELLAKAAPPAPFHKHWQDARCAPRWDVARVLTTP